MAGGVFDGKQEIWDRGRERPVVFEKKKMDAVMRLLKGEDLDSFSARGDRIKSSTRRHWDYLAALRSLYHVENVLRAHALNAE